MEDEDIVVYNLTRIGNINSSLDFIQNINTELMRGWYGVLILGSLFVIIYMAFVFSSKQPVKSFTGASFISFGLAMLLYIAELVPVIAVWVCLIGTAISIAFWKLD